MRNVLIGMILGFALSLGTMAEAGVLSHVAAYEVGKHMGKKAAAKDGCVCPDKANALQKPVPAQGNGD